MPRTVQLEVRSVQLSKQAAKPHATKCGTSKFWENPPADELCIVTGACYNRLAEASVSVGNSRWALIEAGSYSLL